MYLNIPVKLEAYVDVIKQQVKFITNEDKITLLKLGTTKNADSSKLMYLIYNPYPVTMTFDCNSFTKDSNIYKIYPPVMKIGPKTVYAFVAFVSSGNEIRLDEDLILNTMRNNIANRIEKLNHASIQEIEESKIYQIDAEEIVIDKTVDISDLIKINHTAKQAENIPDIIYSPKYEKKIAVSLAEVTVAGEIVKLDVKFENIDHDHNYLLNGFRLKLEDYSSKIIVNAKDPFNLRAGRGKNVYLYIKQSEFQQLDLEHMKLKITIL